MDRNLLVLQIVELKISGLETLTAAECRHGLRDQIDSLCIKRVVLVFLVVNNTLYVQECNRKQKL